MFLQHIDLNSKCFSSGQRDGDLGIPKIIENNEEAETSLVFGIPYDMKCHDISTIAKSFGDLICHEMS